MFWRELVREVDMAKDKRRIASEVSVGFVTNRSSFINRITFLYLGHAGCSHYFERLTFAWWIELSVSAVYIHYGYPGTYGAYIQRFYAAHTAKYTGSIFRVYSLRIRRTYCEHIPLMFTVYFVEETGHFPQCQSRSTRAETCGTSTRPLDLPITSMPYPTKANFNDLAQNFKIRLSTCSPWKPV
jgi:hypothetical protein